MKRLLGLIAILMFAALAARPAPADPTSQRNFPCEEDEALMYSPVSTTNTVCINVATINKEN